MSIACSSVAVEDFAPYAPESCTLEEVKPLNDIAYHLPTSGAVVEYLYQLFDHDEYCQELSFGFVVVDSYAFVYLM